MQARQEIEPSDPVPLPPATHHARWNFPMVYLFLGLMAMAALITAAMIILLCSFRRSNFHRKGVEEACERELEPRVVVIMAGDDKPTFLAQPHILHAPPKQIKLCGKLSRCSSAITPAVRITTREIGELVMISDKHAEDLHSILPCLLGRR